MEKFENEKVGKVVDARKNTEDKLITIIAASTSKTISSKEKDDHKLEKKFELDRSEDDMICEEANGRQHSETGKDSLHDGHTDKLAAHTLCTATSSKATPASPNQTARQASSKRLLSAAIFAKKYPTV